MTTSRSFVLRLLASTGLLVVLAGTFQQPAQAAPLTPFPPGGEYAGETMSYHWVDSFFDIFIDLESPIMGYGPPIAVPGPGPGEVDYTVQLFMSATMCVTGGGCGPSSWGHFAPNGLMRGMDPAPDSSFDTEMLSMDLRGQGVPNPTGPQFEVMIRESPTRQSLGRTALGAGPLQVDSFFDIFTELSLDGGQTWVPDEGDRGDGNSTFSLREIQDIPDVPEPATMILVGTGFAAIARSARRRNRKGTTS